MGASLRSLPRPSRLRAPIDAAPRIKRAAAALGIATVGDLLEYLPHGHRDRRQLTQIAALRLDDEATVEVAVRDARLRPMRDLRKKRCDARVYDESGPMVAVWFNQPWLLKRLTAGTRLRLHGKLRRPGEFWVSEHEELSGGPAVHTDGLVPVYPAGQGLGPEHLRAVCFELREEAANTVEPLPAYLRAGEGLCDRASALLGAHFPQSPEEAQLARRRLAFEELFLLELSLLRRRRARRDERLADRLCPKGELVDRWRAGLGFSLTQDQLNACTEIDSDLRCDQPMQRLLMGEVGSGKTVVAAHAMLRALENGCQTALMAPTETLCEQHAQTLERLFGQVTEVSLLTGSTPDLRRREVLKGLESGEIGIVVGTQALLEPVVSFQSLSLCVVDEQHRFGVKQRAALEAKASGDHRPHVLHLTATPIPRTLALTAYGDLDVTMLRELPAGRRPVSTVICEGSSDRARAYAHARAEIDSGRQCFVVCPLVAESDVLQAKAATAHAKELARGEFAGYRVELIHGQLSAEAKSKAMEAFACGKADLLVATSVIEVGIDVPNASIMLVEAAERYGISQLHQLRGRVGRGEYPARCVLFGNPSAPRLQAIAAENDGFRLAEIDLRLRGAGEVLGSRQHGLEQFKFARLPSDLELLERARNQAEALLSADPELRWSEHALVATASQQRFGSQMEPIPA